MSPTDNLEVNSIIKSLKNCSSPGPDGIPSSVIKFAGPHITPILVKLINLSLINGIFPDRLKMARVVPIFKGGDGSKINNYRPISILNIFSKIYEKVMYKRLSNYLSNKDFFFQNQFGFRKNHSSSMALLSLHDYVTNALDKNEIPISIFIDLSKAFDTLNHSILLKKLEHYGIRGVALSLFQNYLKDRMQCVNYNGMTSSYLSIKCGVPQGSILGPLLFLIYINDICRTSSVLKFILYADDTTILLSSKSLPDLVSLINKELVLVSEWFKTNKLSLNVDKTNFIIFKKSILTDSSLQIKFDNNLIKQISCTKFLGVEINSGLTWKNHITKIENKLATVIGVVRKIRSKITYKTALLLYDALILSQINYCNIVWGSNYVTILKKMLSLQKKALKICAGKHIPKIHKTNLTASSHQSIFKVLKKVKIMDINKIQIAKFIYQTLNKATPTYFTDWFKMTAVVHNHSTRSSSKLFHKPAKSNTRKFCITVRGPLIWNDIPEEIRFSSTISIFVHKLKKSFN